MGERIQEDAAPPCASELVFASTEALLAIVEHHQHKSFVWPDEGCFTDDGWRFNEEHEGRYEPLVIDATTAHLLTAVRGHLEKPENVEKFDRWISTNRGTFGRMLEFCWERARTGPGQA